MNNLYGLIIDGKVYELTEGSCFKCDFFGNGIERCPVKETCTALPYPTEEKDNCFRYSPELTDKLKGE